MRPSISAISSERHGVDSRRLPIVRVQLREAFGSIGEMSRHGHGRRHAQHHHKGYRPAAGLAPQFARQALAPRQDRFAGQETPQVVGQFAGGRIAAGRLAGHRFHADRCRPS